MPKITDDMITIQDTSRISSLRYGIFGGTESGNVVELH